MQLSQFWFQSFTSYFRSCIRSVIPLKFNLSHHYSKLPPTNRDIKDFTKCFHFYLSLSLFYDYCPSCSFLRKISANITFHWEILDCCAVFFCFAIVSLHVSALILISRKWHLSSIKEIQMYHIVDCGYCQYCRYFQYNCSF